MKAKSLLTIIITLLVSPSLSPVSAVAQIRVTIAASAPVDPAFALGSALAGLISRNIPGVQPTVETTTGPADNMRRIGAKTADLGVAGSPVVRDAFLGEGEFAGNPIPIRTLTPTWNLYIHLVTVEGTGINAIAELRGKRVSVGASGTAEERDALRILKAAGIDPDRDVRPERLGLAAAATALREKKIDAFFHFWARALPSPSILDLATTPGLRIKLVGLDSVLPALQREFGSRYFTVTIQKEFYPGMTADIRTVGLASTWVVHEEFSTDLAYQITKLIYEKRGELARAIKDAQYITLIGVAGRSSIPFHPGAIRYFKERGVEGF